MDRYQQLISENRLVSLAVPHGWLMLKNNLFNVDLDWLNELKHSDYDEYFMLMEFSFSYNIFNNYFAMSNGEYGAKYEGVNLYVSSYPIINDEKIVALEYEIDLVMTGKRSRKNSVASRVYCKRFFSLDDVTKALNQLMALVSFQMDNMVNQGNYELIETVLDYQMPE